jgi:hypothetical protein
MDLKRPQNWFALAKHHNALFDNSNSMPLTGMPTTLFPINENHSGVTFRSPRQPWKINARLGKKNNGSAAADKTSNNYNACEKNWEWKLYKKGAALTIHHLYSSQQGLKKGAVESDLLNRYVYHLTEYSYHDCLAIYQKLPGRNKQSTVNQAIHYR